jgi:uncharacterized protein
LADGSLRFVVGSLRWSGIEFPSRIRQIGAVKRLFVPILTLATLSLALLATGCKPAATSTLPTLTEDYNDPTAAQPKLPTMKIYMGPEMLEAELALTPRQEQIGMMYRTNIQETDAMLFALPYPMQASFWMKHCPESISAAYITPDGVIQEIRHLEQNDTNSMVSARQDIQFVLETKEGWFARHHITTGMVIVSEKGPLADVFLRKQ